MAATKTGANSLSAQERRAVKERAAELRAEATREKGRARAAAELADVLAKIASMPEADRTLAEQLHRVVAEAAPHLSPKLYYGQPGYAHSGKVLCFFRSGIMDGERYSTFGFSALAQLDDAGGLWPTAYALIDPDEAAWATIAELIRRAAPEPPRTPDPTREDTP
ncbi:DUF1801 domain-containing protein [Leucobacter sp. M11]|uniref:DUF1801 domain-containing protein n=1 Tax=Leucobacter sp. M11 TaxID=2993565 RepID=UPI002D7F1036|nr:DUF1801 domain-containing protein [Leucobacter sp. M11]MEB4616399.1 DUF1801 domain-containing protein [Leucobacter sp. M11]